MFLAWRELVFARGRFGLMGGVVALVAVLGVMLSGLSSGLVNDGVSGLKKLPVTSFAFGENTSIDSGFSRSVVDRDQLAHWSERDDVADAALFGNQLVNGEGPEGEPVDLALFGVEPGSFVAPAADDVVERADGSAHPVLARRERDRVLTKVKVDVGRNGRMDRTVADAVAGRDVGHGQ